ncbi:MAG: hypothetical protein KJ607_10840 [Bacteroidetes bacterium]|nr:hypothetical protein [Bacteroidota bacterium]
MMSYISKISAMLLASLVLLSGSGVGVYHHYCACLELNYIQLFTDSECCNHNDPHHHCMGGYCHGKKEHHKDSSVTVSYDRCCKEEFNYLKNDYVCSSSELTNKLPVYQDFSVITTTPIYPFLTDLLPVRKVRAPPVIQHTGKYRLISFRQLKIHCCQS